MISKSSSLYIAVALVLAWLPATDGFAQEARCTELGSNCLCSETLDWDSGGDLRDGLTDPSNSNTKECNGGGAVNVLTGGKYRTELTSIRGGISGPTRVLKRDSGSGNLLDSAYRVFTDSTICARIYRRDDNAAVQNATSLNGTDFKGMLMDKDKIGGTSSEHSPHLDLEWKKTGSGENAKMTFQWVSKSSGWMASSTSIPSVGSSQVTLRNVSDDGWGRYEICADHNPSSISPADRIHVRARLCRLSDGVCDSWAGTSTNSQPTANTGSRFMPARFFIEVAGGSGWDVHLSHMMVAKVSPANTNFWIGSASEIANDSGGGSSPPPPAAPPVENPPIAQNDSYELDQGSSISISSSGGVLGNDSDPDGDSIWAVLANDPSAGTVNLASDGSFTYQHGGGSGSTDSFQYEAWDASGRKDTATVTLIFSTAPGGGDPPGNESLGRPGRPYVQ